MNFGKISAATIARTAVLLLALTNQVLSALGKPISFFVVGTILQQSLYVGALGGRLQSLDCSFPKCFCPDYT